MEGVVFLVVVFLLWAGGRAAEICPEETCKCLGNYVECGGNLLSLPNNIPTWTTDLDVANNSIRYINATSLSRLNKLKKLNLRKNKIVSIDIEAFRNNTNLTHLDLSRNMINMIAPLTFQNQEKLKELNVRHNNISVLNDATFYGMKHSKVLILDYNYIRIIQKGWLYGLESLERLVLSNNAISVIEWTAWECVPRLKDLNLAYNQLVAIKSNTFSKLGGLVRLNLNNNNITYIADNAFSNTPKLKSLHLNNNHISLIIEDASGSLHWLDNLEKLYIASNNIKTIKRNSFTGLEKLTHLDLSHNNVTSIQKNAFSEMHSLKVLKMNSSSLVCDCNLQWFYNELKKNELLQTHMQLTCAYPESLKKLPLLSVPKENFTCDIFVKPRLIEKPVAEIMTLKGENVTLTCKAVSSSSSNMTILWKKDGKDVYKANITDTVNSVNARSTEGFSSMTLYDVQQSDSGKYQCIVSNKFGTVYSPKCSISVLIFPQFIKVPKNVTVQSGTSVSLECRATGEPKPEISWQKDGGIVFPAAKERRIRVMPEEDVFVLLNLKPEDMGVYTCMAYNPAGTIVANASVIVEQKPYFSKKMEDREVTMGESVVLKCMAGGQPKPTISWLKNGDLIHPTERHFFTAEDQLMIIIDADLKDAGTYQCVLKNSLGISNASSTLVVKKGTTTDVINNKMGIIIITVVCCAILTSIVWVVIIFQARRRMKPQASGDASGNQDPTVIEFTEKTATNFPDNISEHSSCKDSGTGDSAKRSNDDLLPENEYTLIINNVSSGEVPKTMRAASLVYVPSEGNASHSPLLHTDCPTFPRTTNHNRLRSPTTQIHPSPQNTQQQQAEVVVIENYPREDSQG